MITYFLCPCQIVLSFMMYLLIIKKGRLPFFYYTIYSAILI